MIIPTKKILLLGAGRSSSSLIRYLLEASEKNQWQVIIGDVSETAAREKTGSHTHARAIHFDVNDAGQRMAEVKAADLVISLLPPHLHYLVAVDCVTCSRHFLTASYLTPEMQDLHDAAVKKGILILNECGLDPGIDHMSAMEVIHRLQDEGCELQSFKSYTGGLVAPESNDNPWGYKFSWNPRNVILAGQGTARYILEGTYKYIPYNRLFTDIEKIEVGDLGLFDGYANRDSLAYRAHYGIENIPTLLRGTLRQTGFCRAWDVLVRLGFTDDTYKIEKPETLTYAQLVRALLPASAQKPNLVEAVAAFCNLPPDGEAMSKIIWTGILEEDKINLIQMDATTAVDATPAIILQHLLEKKWVLQPHDKDMIVMQHQFVFIRNNKTEKLISSLIVIGDDQQFTAMAKTVGLPLGIAAKLILENKILLTGVHIPVKKEIYEPVLKELEQSGIRFTEKKS